jgi:leader peptidase (prepilin peptidase) / N-methyltransferase
MWWLVVAGLGGVGAGWLARVVLGRVRYPVRVPRGLAEGVMCLLWTVTAVRGLPAWWLPVPALVSWLAVVLTATDLAHRRLPDAVTLTGYPLIAAAIWSACLGGGDRELGVRALVAAAVLVVVHAAVHLAAPGQLGAGDVKLAGVVGAVLGAVSWPAVLVGLVIAAAVTAMLATAMAGRGEHGVPHGPGMLAGALLLAAFHGPGVPSG